VQDIHVIENHNEWSPAPDVERGSSKWLSVYRYRNEGENTSICLDGLRDKGYRIAATTPHTEMSIFDVPLNEPIALVFGAEKRGVSKTTFEKADYRIRIPMYGFTESFNISVAAALSLHTFRERIKSENIAFGLSEEEKEALFFEWTTRSIPKPKLLIEEYHRRQKRL
jgi:tRNA (guanosine-2'-O-)-methyltransferase